jgi:hypothetical protein
MEKKTRKLVLSKETLRSLAEAELKKAPGGIVSSDDRWCMNDPNFSHYC